MLPLPSRARGAAGLASLQSIATSRSKMTFRGVSGLILTAAITPLGAQLREWRR